MTAKKRPFNRRIDKEAVGTTDTIDDHRVPDGFRRCYQRFGVLNDTTAYTLLRFVKGPTSPPFIISEEQIPGVDEFVWDDTEVWCVEGEYLRASMSGCTVADDISLHVSGFDVAIGDGD